MVTRTKSRGKKVQPVRTLEQVALDAFAETGEVSGLGVLADWLDEFQPERAEFSAQLRAVMADVFKAEGVRFFMVNAVYAVSEGETEQYAKFNCAYGLKEAEEWFEEREAVNESDPSFDDMRFHWELDHHYSPSDYDSPDMPEEGWVCFLQIYTARGWHSEEVLGGVTFAEGEDPWSSNYARVLRAELASEQMS